MALEPLSPSALTSYLTSMTKPSSTSSDHHALALQIQHNLQHQHQWTNLTMHTHSPLDSRPLPRALLSGLPPKRLYVHPDEQIALLKAHRAANPTKDGKGEEEELGLTPEREWVLPTHLRESWSLKKIADVFEGIGAVPPAPNVQEQERGNEEDNDEANKWRGVKRVLLATLDDDSTITYYILHDGLVKPRQN